MLIERQPNTTEKAKQYVAINGLFWKTQGYKVNPLHEELQDQLASNHPK